MNVSTFLCSVVLFFSLPWSISTMSKQLLLVWVVAIVSTVGYFLFNIRECAGIGSVNTGADVEWISVCGRVCG